MKRAHRRWHRIIGCLLVPVLAALLGLLAWRLGTPPANTTLPPAVATVNESR